MPFLMIALVGLLLVSVVPAQADTFRTITDRDTFVNVVKGKAFSNVRESTKEATVVLAAPRTITLESALEYIEADEGRD